MSDGLDARRPSVPVSRYALFLLTAIVGLAADLVSKEVVFSWPGKLTGKVWWVWEGYFGLQTSLNEGALFGLGQGAVAVFAGISIVAAFAIPVWLFALRAAQDAWITFALGLVMSGVLGNLYDRLGLAGEVWLEGDPRAVGRVGETAYAVRDWVLWQLEGWFTWPNFNLADAFLVTGAGILMLRALYEGEDEVATETAED